MIQIFRQELFPYFVEKLSGCSIHLYNFFSKMLISRSRQTDVRTTVLSQVYLTLCDLFYLYFWIYSWIFVKIWHGFIMVFRGIKETLFLKKPEAANLVQTFFKFKQDAVFRKVESRFRFMWKWTLHFSVQKHIPIDSFRSTRPISSKMNYGICYLGKLTNRVQSQCVILRKCIVQYTSS